MPGDLIRIDELDLRLPGVNRDEAALLGQEVARHLAKHRFDFVGSRDFGALDLRVNVPIGTPRSLLAGTIAKCIASAIR